VIPCKDVLFVGSVVAAPHLGDQILPKPYFGGSLIGFFKPNAQNNETCILSQLDYCIDSNQILHNTKDNQVLIVGGPNTRPYKPKMADGRHFGKKVLSPYLCSRLTAFNEIWHGDAYWHTGDRQ